MILWSKATGARHATSSACTAALAAAASAPASPSLPDADAPTMDLKPVADFLAAARSRGLKFPKARFLAPGGGEMRLTMTGSRSVAPAGSVNVLTVVNGVRTWLGRVEPDGRVVGFRLKANDAVRDALAAIVADPAKAASDYGSLMAACSFCGKALTDAGSVEVGYGPVCAAKFGLPHKPRGTPELKAVA
jgi:hypothetical protein